MHFFCLDETGCDGRKLDNPEKPIFILGGIILRDKGWNITHAEFVNIISEYFNGETPENFEFHTEDLFSENGSGHFEGHSREARNKLIHAILDLVKSRNHQFFYFAIDKSKLDLYDTSSVRNRGYFDLKTPYLIAYDYLISACDLHMKTRGSSGRAMFIIDEKDMLIDEIERVTRYRRFKIPKSKRSKRIVEFSFAVDSKKNTMIQLSDMLIYLTRKFIEIEHEYKSEMSAAVKEIFRGFYDKIHKRVIHKSILQDSGRKANTYNDFINEISCIPTRTWKSRKY